MPFYPPSSVPPQPEEIAKAIAQKQGWTAPGNVLQAITLLIAVAALILSIVR